MPEMTFEIVVTVSEDRHNPGLLLVKNAAGEIKFGPIPIYAISDQTEANARLNPSRDPLQSGGDTPLGAYTVEAVVDSPPGTRLGDARTRTGLLSYGTEGVIKLVPLGGDAKAAADGPARRSGIWIHGGDLNAAGQMRPTHGCIRVAPGDMGRLTHAIQEISDAHLPMQCAIAQGRVVVAEALALGPTCEDDFLDPPPDDLLQEAKVEVERRRQEERDRARAQKEAEDHRLVEEERQRKEEELRRQEEAAVAAHREWERQLLERAEKQRAEDAESRRKQEDERRAREARERETQLREQREREERERHAADERQKEFEKRDRERLGQAAALERERIQREEDSRRLHEREEQYRRDREEQTRREMQDRARQQAEEERRRREEEQRRKP